MPRYETAKVKATASARLLLRLDFAGRRQSGSRIVITRMFWLFRYLGVLSDNLVSDVGATCREMTASPLKSLPKGLGFSPIPFRGQ